jgi:hypothetical protein
MEEPHYSCLHCERSFPTSRGLSVHITLRDECSDAYSPSTRERQAMFTEHSSSVRTESRTNEELLTSANGRARLGQESIFSDDVSVGMEDNDFDEGGSDGDGDAGVIGDANGFDANDVEEEGDPDGDDGDDGDNGDVPFSYKPVLHTEADFVDVLLLSVCEKIGAPRYAFDMIKDWASYAQTLNYDFSSGCRNKRASTMDRLRKGFCLENLRPSTTVVRVPDATLDDVMRVVTVDFVSAAKSMLQDPDLMDPRNLVVNPDDPYAMYVSPDGTLGEINSGKAYQRAYAHCITKPNQFLAPLGAYTDRSGLGDFHQRFGVEPFRITFTIFKESLRNLHFSWRTIGYIFDLFHHSAKQHASREVSSVFWSLVS